MKFNLAHLLLPLLATALPTPTPNAEPNPQPQVLEAIGEVVATELPEKVALMVSVLDAGFAWDILCHLWRDHVWFRNGSPDERAREFKEDHQDERKDAWNALKSQPDQDLKEKVQKWTILDSGNELPLKKKKKPPQPTDPAEHDLPLPLPPTKIPEGPEGPEGPEEPSS